MKISKRNDQSWDTILTDDKGGEWVPLKEADSRIKFLSWIAVINCVFGLSMMFINAK